jgi:glyoxylase-like metal-dependent hydrolase (beta-lactamase superfamily II)
MRAHHINCSTMCPAGAKLIAGEGGLFARARLVCHCLVVEGPDGLVLIDTGIGTADMADPKRRLGGGFLAFAAPKLDQEETALAQIKKLGLSPNDVRHIVPTHLDLDHAGGLPDFPHATVHLHAKELAAAQERATLNERERYKPAQWAHGPKWKTYQESGETWNGFDAVRGVAGTKDEILIVPLHGHTRGHAGVAVKTARGWLLHAGDAYFHRGEMDPDRPRCPSALAFFQRAIAVDDAARVRNQGRLRALARDRHGEVTVFSAHDPVELERCASLDASDAEPAARVRVSI